MARHIPPPAPTPQRTLLALRLGATLFGVLAGVACYIALDQFTSIGMGSAFIIGLIFALLTRAAAASLAHDWLIRAARRSADHETDQEATSRRG